MRDLDIRRALRQRLSAAHGCEEGTLIIDELGVCQGNVRIDMAVVNGFLNGYEIKSEQDTLGRLPVQASIYSKVFDTITIITGARHLEPIQKLVPNWWGILRADDSLPPTIRLELIQPPQPNPLVEPLALVQLLWRNETLAILKTRGLKRGLTNKPRRVLWRNLVEHFSLDELRLVVREHLKARQTWRVARLQESDGGTFQPCAMS